MTTQPERLTRSSITCWRCGRASELQLDLADRFPIEIPTCTTCGARANVSIHHEGPGTWTIEIKPAP